MSIKITNTQLEKLEPYIFENYISELVVKFNKAFPYLEKILGEDNFRQALKEAVAKAEDSGFTQRGSVFFYINMVLIFGIGFESDPQYPWIYTCLERNNNLPELERSDRLYEFASDYLDKTLGEQEQYLLLFSRRFQKFGLEHLNINKKSYVEDTHRLLNGFYPEKYQHTKPEHIDALIKKVTTKAYHHYDFENINNHVLMVLLAFLMGYEFDQDPFKPWCNQQVLMQYQDNSLLTSKFEEIIKIWLQATLSSNPEQEVGRSYD